MVKVLFQSITQLVRRDVSAVFQHGGWQSGKCNLYSLFKKDN